MIDYTYEISGISIEEGKYTDWLNKVADNEGFSIGEISYVFVNDEELRSMNKKYLDHDYYTDIITFDYSEIKNLNGDIFISIDRVRENATKFNVTREEELRRVMVHGILHLMGYKDGTTDEKNVMRTLEDINIKMFHVEQ